MSGWWRRNRLGVLLAAGVLLVLAAAAVFAGQGPRGVLDPAAYDPDGAHALEVLLHQQGVHVTRTVDVPSTVAAATKDSTVFIPIPSELSPEELQALSGLPGSLVVAEGLTDDLQALGVHASVVDTQDTGRRSPHCDLPLASNAGRALTGGVEYTTPSGAACYPGHRGASLVTADGGRVTLIGAAATFTNAHLDQDGNAALGIGLLAQHPTVVWLVPSPTRAAYGHRRISSPNDLLPSWIRAARWQLFIAAAFLALWRGRRLGRVVSENLPVVVRASETVEGHGRLYRAARAHPAAAEALRETARRTLSRLVHAGSATPDGLVQLVAVRSGRDERDVRDLLYGPAPADDTALVRLADDLDSLVRQALTREAAAT